MPLPHVDNNNDLSSYNIFSNGDVSTSSTIEVGDIGGALFIGSSAYILVVVLFSIGLFGVGKFYFSQSDGSVDALDGMNFIRILLKPMSFLFIGVFMFSVIGSIIEYWYNVDISSRVKFFLEVDYESMVSNIKAKSSILIVAKKMLFILHIASAFAFWSIIILFISMYFVVFGFVLSILLNKSDASVLKKIFSSGFTASIAFMAITIYSTNIDRVFFKDNPRINSINKNISSLSIGTTEVSKYMIKKALSTN